MERKSSSQKCCMILTGKRPEREKIEKGNLEFGKKSMLSKESKEPEKAKSAKLVFGLRLTKPPKEEEWEKAAEIDLMDNNTLSELPEKPMCPILLELYLQGSYKLTKIPPSFFGHMPALQILDLSNTGINSLPESLFGLVGLKELFLNCCPNFMVLSPEVGKLEGLEVLDLEGTEIISLPMEVKKLTNLRCLKVSLYGCMKHGRKKEESNAMIHGGVIAALSQLRQLNIDVNPDDGRWAKIVEALINEVADLPLLCSLNLYIPRVELLSSLKWCKFFRFIVGHHCERVISRIPLYAVFELEHSDRCLQYINGEDIPKDIKKILRVATAFHLDRHLTVKKLSEFHLENMKELKCCVLGECNEVQVIIDGKDIHEEVHDSEIVCETGTDDEKIGLESLEYLNIYYMKNLRSIWEGPMHKGCFSLLMILTLRTCPKLTTIFTLGLLGNLNKLAVLDIYDCPSIKSLVSRENSAEREDSSSIVEYYLPNLKTISLYYVPELVSLFNGLPIAPKLRCLSFSNCPQLKSLSIEELSSTNLEKICGERDWWEALEWRNGKPDNLDDIFNPIDSTC